MRTSPTVQLTLQRFASWRIAAALLTALGFAAQLAWASTLPGPARPVMLALGGCVGVAMLLVGASLARVDATRLRWDEQGWHAGAAGAAEGEWVAGRLVAVLDLGPWMLLRFTPTAPTRRRALWLPAQRSDLKGQWHALRCAVHSPRVAAAVRSATGP